MSTQRILLLPKLKIQNANALSSPFTIGFPAMTAWLGSIHALQRQLNQQGFEALAFNRVGIVCHDFDLQTYKGRGDYIHSIVGTGNPLDKDGNRPAFIEEARCHLTVSLVVECDGITPFMQNSLEEKIPATLHTLKFASGDLLEFKPPEILVVDDGVSCRKLFRRMIPGYALVDRRELMIEAMQQGQDALDALLDHLTLQHRCDQDEQGNVTWRTQRKMQGWIVPIATGFHGITDLTPPGQTLNQRDPEVPHRFAEAVVTLGEFRMPYRLDNLDEFMWHYHYDNENQLYLCQQNNHKNQQSNI